MINNSIDIFFNKVLFKFHMWEKKKKFERDPPLLLSIHFCYCVLLNKLLIVYILFFIIYLEEDFFLKKKNLIVHVQI